MSNVKHISYYTNVMQGWSKALGSKPTEAQLSLAHVFGRPGKQSLAVALALRSEGVTGNQIKQVSSLFDGKATPQLNHMRDLIAAGMFKREAVPGAYALTLAAKGQTFVSHHGKPATEKPVAEPKAKKAKVSKPRKVKAVPVTDSDVPASVPVNAPVAEQPAA